MAIASEKGRLSLQDQPQKAFEVDANLKDRVNRPRRHGGEVLALTDNSSEGAARGLPTWLPPGFGPLLPAESFAAWQQAMRTEAPPPGSKAHFEDWQRRVAELAPLPLPPPPALLPALPPAPLALP